jgi:hypothetical protein
MIGANLAADQCIRRYPLDSEACYERLSLINMGRMS